MFDYVDPGMDRVTIIFYWCAVPFSLAWIIHNSLWTGFGLEAYLITYLVFILDPFQMQKQYVRKWWYWRVMLRAGAVVHPLFLIGLWFLDKAYPELVTSSGDLFFMVSVIFVIEMIILGETVKRFRPENQV